ncbi:hypothetical protein LSTR_LSTR014601 [Laodelphax striatellus]|uniref:Uncharacterized protein n=1 Tax=Laodelphax striatellus TaxID=195883 RepID=A0A482WRM7_LAOST|nr:hypothetical protein LSTR_LSTR014601 [Laodelphax striatellus]
MENKDKQVAEGAGEQVQVDAEHQEELSVNNDLGYNPNDQQVFNEEVAEGNVDEEERVQVYNELLQELRRLELQEELRRLNNSVRNGLGLIFPILTSSSSDGTSSSTSSFSSTTSSLSSEGNREEQYLRAQQARLQAARNEEFYYRVGSCFILLCSALFLCRYLLDR